VNEFSASARFLCSIAGSVCPSRINEHLSRRNADGTITAIESFTEVVSDWHSAVGKPIQDINYERHFSRCLLSGKMGKKRSTLLSEQSQAQISRVEHLQFDQSRFRQTASKLPRLTWEVAQSDDWNQSHRFQMRMDIRKEPISKGEDLSMIREVGTGNDSQCG
jgi:hypothetical protein